MKFVFDKFLEENLNLTETGPVYCPKFQTGECWGNCNLVHIKYASAVVCKHWLRGMCKKNEKCDYLHEYIIKKLPECFFFNVYGICNNNECMFLHVDQSSKAKICHFYSKGFCRNGPHCKNKHIRKDLCWNYFNGFCRHGENCKLGHPNFSKEHVEVKDSEIINRRKFQ